MAIGKREKIIAFSVVGLAAIALVHTLIFAKTAKAHNDALGRRATAAGQVGQLKRPASNSQISEYSEKTGEYKKQFVQVMREFNMVPPKAWQQQDSDPRVREERWKDLFALLDRLRELRAQGAQPNHPTLNFLGQALDNKKGISAGWNFPTGLPRAVQAKQANLYDTLNELLGNYKSVLAAQDTTNQAFREQQYRNYGATLAKLDINYEYDVLQFYNFTQLPAASLFDIQQLAGPAVPFLKTVEHVRLFTANAPRDLGGDLANRDKLLEILGQSAEVGARQVPSRPDYLYPLPEGTGTLGGDSGKIEVNIKVNPGVLPLYRQQLASLIDLIERADRAGIASVEFVKLREYIVIKDLPPPPGSPPPGPTLDPNGYPLPPAEPGTTDVAISTPIEMSVVGTNQATAAFLHDISHCTRPYELDSMRLARVQGAQQTLLQMDISINILANVYGLDSTMLDPEAGAGPAPGMATAPASLAP
jgi:hypothetical protein